MRCTPFPIRLEGLGERRKPQLGRKRILVHFELEKTNLVMKKSNSNLLMMNLIFFCHFYNAYFVTFARLAVSGTVRCKDTYQPKLASSETHRPSIKFSCTPSDVEDIRNL